MAGLQNRPPQKQINKKISAAQLGSEYDNTMNERRQPSRGWKRKMKTMADSNYFYTEKQSRARITQYFGEKGLVG